VVNSREIGKDADRPVFFYGWTIVVISMIGMVLVYGIRHSFSVFFSSILAEFSWTRGDISLMFSFNVLIYGFSAPVSGYLAEQWNPKRMMILGIFILSGVTAACSLAKELWHFYLLFGMMVSLGSALCGWPVIAPTLMKWFIRGRGLALGLGQLGGGLSFVYGIFVGWMIRCFGWRVTFLILSGLLLSVLLPLYLLYFHPRPQQIGLQPYGSDELLSGSQSNSVHPDFEQLHWTLGRMLRSPRLWLLVISYALFWGVGGYAVIAHQVKFIEDAGFSNAFAVFIFAVTGSSIMLGQLSGFLSDRIGREKAGSLAAFLSIIGLMVLITVRNPSQSSLLYVHAVFFGYGAGLFSPTIFAGAADIFSGRSFGPVAGLILTGMGIGGVIGPWMAGYLFDLSGSYAPAFILCMLCIFLGSVSFWIASPRKCGHRRT
jgi:sugar phosphate permease